MRLQAIITVGPLFYLIDALRRLNVGGGARVPSLSLLSSFPFHPVLHVLHAWLLMHPRDLHKTPGCLPLRSPHPPPEIYRVNFYLDGRAADHHDNDWQLIIEVSMATFFKQRKAILERGGRAWAFSGQFIGRMDQIGHCLGGKRGWGSSGNERQGSTRLKGHSDLHYNTYHGNVCSRPGIKGPSLKYLEANEVKYFSLGGGGGGRG